ncbi:hypothetical protein ACIPSE_09060 [Streptomyces sp. NPDC090106]|uniref:hypothetical protein n=1 Tax=Streptomyces sp. NPDC090106 TaxID=3365946 RepID=UPI0038051760
MTDSSLDDVLHVPPCSLGESKEILRTRTSVIDDQYALLAHGLSAGMPRDLVRYGRRLADLTDFAGYETGGLSDEPRVLVEEAAVHVCFGLTVLEIFGGDDFSGRLTATGRPDGDLELLARARQELPLSPHGARGVLDELRRIWRLERLPARG